MSNLTGKVALVTGATNGLGKVTALELAKLNATVVVVGRNPSKTEATVAEIKAISGNPSVAMLLADLSSMAEVRQLAEQFRANYDRLDILVNNAGGVFSTRQETVDGYELTFALNHLAYFLLTNLLLDVLKSSAPARIVNVASGVHNTGKINFDDLNSQKRYQIYGAYAASKLANVLFTYELARRLPDNTVTVNALAPGSVASGFGHNNGRLFNFGAYLIHLFSKTPEQGAETIVYLAASPDVEDITGQYFEDCQAIASSKQSYDKDIARQLWNKSAELVNLQSEPIKILNRLAH